MRQEFSLLRDEGNLEHTFFGPELFHGAHLLHPGFVCVRPAQHVVEETYLDVARKSRSHPPKLYCNG